MVREAGEGAGHLLLKLLADEGIEQMKFVFKVGVEGGSIQPRPRGDVVDRNGGKAQSTIAKTRHR